jgi:hypothetical protein
MIALVLALALSAQACELEDAACWRTMALEQVERAERAEQRANLEASARDIVEKMIAEETKRADRWKETAIAVAPKQPMFWESPMFWGGIGLLVGAAATIGVVYGVAPAFRPAQ